MRSRGVVALVLVAVGLGTAIVVGPGFGWAGGSVDERWLSDTGRDVGGNHHAVAVYAAGSESMVFAPISGAGGSEDCELVALEAIDGSVRWEYAVPFEVCTIHAVANPTVADYDGDATPEVLAATTERVLVAIDPHTGVVERRFPLSAYGYSAPIVTDLSGDGTPEVVIVDVRGTVSVFDAAGRTVWTRNRSRFTWGQPAAGDVDGDGRDELVVGEGGTGAVTVFEADGSVLWTRSSIVDGSITWMTTAADRRGLDIFVATTTGTVAAIDGRDGTVAWRRDLGSFAAVRAVGDGNDDGILEVYAVAKDGVLRSLDAEDGTVEWETTLTSAAVQMTPPPSIADLDGDGQPELAAVTNDGTVAVIEPGTGRIRATYRRDVPVFVHPTLADADADGAAEVYVMYGDGRVAALSYQPGGSGGVLFVRPTPAPRA